MTDSMTLELLNCDKKILFLEKQNKKLDAKIKILENNEIKISDISKSLIVKDKMIYKLKCGVSSIVSELNEEMIPKSYLRISERFPHLNLKEIIAFEKLAIENGGSIKTHSGNFIYTHRKKSNYDCNGGYNLNFID
jgi:hypothetical protein